MRLRERYRRLTLWNKIACWGSMASILGLVVPFPPSWPAQSILSSERKRDFIQTLATSPTPREQIRLSCPGADEQKCILAGGLLKLFIAANWKVLGDQVVRGQLGKPPPRYRSAQARQNDATATPGSGVWVVMSHSLVSLQRAFAGLGLPVETSAEASQPEGVITVFVGPI
jgi:hypothetical protein